MSLARPYTLTLGIAVVAAAACHSRGAAPPPEPQATEVVIDSVRYASLPTMRVDSNIVVGVRATNLSAAQIRLIVPGGCTVQLTLARQRPASDRRAGAWDSRAREGILCVTSGIVLTLAPGASQDVKDSVPVAEILGDSLPAGVYGASVILHASKWKSQGDRVVGPLAAGTIVVNRP